jgi:hypothetical protein
MLSEENIVIGLMSFALKCFFKRNFATEFKENLSSH